MEENQLPDTVRGLRRRWKPTKDRLQRASGGHPLAIRMHRTFSWMAAVEKYADRENVDQQLIFRWIALNALYGRWNADAGEPERDQSSLRRFLATMERIDGAGVVEQCLRDHKRLVVSICSDPFVNSHFWRILDTDRRFDARRGKFSIERMYVAQKWCSILASVLERIYLVRCQLVHGAATHESSLNRDTVRRCSLMLNHLLFCLTTVITDHGLTECWDDLCYPPVDSTESRQLRTAKPR